MRSWVPRLQAIGWIGPAGVALLAGCAAAYLLAIVPAQERLEAARVSIARARATGGERPRATVEQQLAAFYRSLPADRTAVAVAGKVVELAQRHGIAIRQATYRLEPDRATRLTRLLVTMPVRAQYPALREFLSELHGELPAATVDQVQFERRDIGEREVDARVRLVIFLERTTS